MISLLKISCVQRHFTPDTRLMALNYEPVAIDKYHKYMHSQKTPVHVFKTGFVVCTNCPILGCSPDAKVIDPNCEDPFGLLEVKCPETKFQVSPLDACSGP